MDHVCLQAFDLCEDRSCSVCAHFTCVIIDIINSHIVRERARQCAPPTLGVVNRICKHAFPAQLDLIGICLRLSGWDMAQVPTNCPNPLPS